MKARSLALVVDVRRQGRNGSAKANQSVSKCTREIKNLTKRTHDSSVHPHISLSQLRSDSELPALEELLELVQVLEQVDDSSLVGTLSARKSTLVDGVVDLRCQQGVSKLHE